MNGQHKNFIHALMLKKTKVPIWELEFHAWNHFSDDRVIVGNEFSELSTAAKQKAIDQNAHVIAAVSEKLHFSAVTVPGGYWEKAPGHPAYWWLPNDYRFQQIEAIVQKAPNVIPVASSGGVMAMPAADEYVEFSCNLLEAPQEIDAHAQNTLRHGVALAQKLADHGVQAVYTASDISDNHGPYFNPEQMQRFILPYLQKWAEKVKAMGLLTILHTDGNITPYLQDIADSGIHALQAIDPIAGMDIVQVKKEIGDKICLCGNIDCGLFLAGKADKIYTSTMHVLTNCSSDGGFVLGASNALEAQVTAENYMAMIKAWEAFYA